MRIVSLLPSATEIVCELGLIDNLVGVTHECDYPASVRGLPVVTKTFIPQDATSAEIDSLVRERMKIERALYSLDLPTLEQVRPDLIITQTLCDVCAVAESEVNAAVCHLPGNPKIINLEPTNLEEVLQSIHDVGDAVGISDQAKEIVGRLRARIDAVVNRSASIVNRPRVVLLEWIDPPFSSGHWSPDLVCMAGGIEVIGRASQRSRTIDWQEVVQVDPEFLVIACCGFNIDRTLQDLPILAKYAGLETMKCVRSDNVYVIDGNAYFNRPGPRLVDSLEILANVLHPDVHPLPRGLVGARKVTGDELLVTTR